MSVTTPRGFVASGTACGIKGPNAPDLALVATDDGRSVPAAAVFTTNLAAAAPVLVSRAHLTATAGQAAAVILNSGNANAATGERGHNDAERMCQLVATGIGCQPAAVLVCSTGLIGIPLPIDAIEAGMAELLRRRAGDGGQDAAEAILTTDTHAKQVVVAGDRFMVGGMAKGAAMLAPHMATMLAVLTTDAEVKPQPLRRALADAVARSFNQLTTDGATSTNDAVIVLASGRREVEPDEAELTEALWEACSDLAGQMADDAEGSTKVVRVRVTGAASNGDAAQGARRIADSQLVKCSFYGEDPYWGRIVSELGSAGIAFDPASVSVSYGGITVCTGGVEAPSYNADALKSAMAQRSIEVVADLAIGDGEGAVLTVDLTHGYIDENMRTS
jgi:glutamate N-acetyltransferase / amino-acid N-acetyltransferase